METLYFDGSIHSIDDINRCVESLDYDCCINLSGVFYGALKLHDLQRKLTIVGEKCLIDGTKCIETSFSLHSENIYKTHLESGLNIERLWIDERAYILARYPNCDVNSRERIYTDISTAKARLLKAKDPKGAFLRGLHTHEWGGNDYKVLGNENGELELEWVGNNNRGSGLSPNNVLIENVYEELDHPCEFYYDNKNGVLYVYSDTDMSGVHTLCYANQHTLIDVSGCRNGLSIDNITFRRSDRSTYKGKWSRYLRSDWGYNDLSAFSITDSSNISVSNCAFTDLGDTAMLIRDNSYDIAISDCSFNESLSNGVLILGNPDSTYCTSCWDNDNHVTYMESDGKCGAKNNGYPHNVTISECLFEWLGKEDLQSAGVCISLSHNVTVKNCTLRHLPRAGINIAENAFGGHLITHCDIYDCVRDTGDHGPFNSWGRDRFWSLNRYDTLGKYGKEKHPYATADMLSRNELSYNRVMGVKGFGIDLDDGSSAYDIHHNLCIGVGIKLREGFERNVYNNVMIDAPLDYHCAFEDNSDNIHDNVVANGKAIRCVLENKGSNVTFTNNYWIHKKAKKTKRFLPIKNITAEQILNGEYSLPNVELLKAQYGKADVSKPEVSLSTDSSICRIKRRLSYTLATVDESIRTVTGSSDYVGVYVSKLSKSSKLYRLGIRQGDLIKKINSDNVDIDNVTSLINKYYRITLIRDQKELTLKKQERS